RADHVKLIRSILDRVKLPTAEAGGRQYGGRSRRSLSNHLPQRLLTGDPLPGRQPIRLGGGGASVAARANGIRPWPERVGSDTALLHHERVRPASGIHVSDRTLQS